MHQKECLLPSYPNKTGIGGIITDFEQVVSYDGKDYLVQANSMLIDDVRFGSTVRAITVHELRGPLHGEYTTKLPQNGRVYRTNVADVVDLEIQDALTDIVRNELGLKESINFGSVPDTRQPSRIFTMEPPLYV